MRTTEITSTVNKIIRDFNITDAVDLGYDKEIKTIFGKLAIRFEVDVQLKIVTLFGRFTENPEIAMKELHKMNPKYNLHISTKGATKESLYSDLKLHLSYVL
jgi:hypothetical protein